MLEAHRPTAMGLDPGPPRNASDQNWMRAPHWIWRASRAVV